MLPKIIVSYSKKLTPKYYLMLSSHVIYQALSKLKLKLHGFRRVKVTFVLFKCKRRSGVLSKSFSKLI